MRMVKIKGFNLRSLGDVGLRVFRFLSWGIILKDNRTGFRLVVRGPCQNESLLDKEVWKDGR